MAESREELTREQMIETVAKALCRKFHVARSIEEMVSPNRKLWQRYEEDAAIAVDTLRSLSRDSRAAGKIALFTNRDQKMFDRLVERRDLLQRRIDASESEKATEESRQEQHALDWAIARLCDGLQAPKSARTGGGK